MNLLIKLSGEFFDANDEMTSDGLQFLKAIKDIDRGYVVVGGGNRVRGRDSTHSRPVSDQIGVLSTLMNGYILQEKLAKQRQKSKLFSHFLGFGEYYSAKDAEDAYNAGNWVILTTGLGKVAYISTDVSSVIKALEVNAQGLVKITPAGGIYDKDPKKFNDAKLIKNISHDEVLQNKLAVMDAAAVAIASENNLPIAIISLNDFEKFLKKENVGSFIGEDWRA